VNTLQLITSLQPDEFTSILHDTQVYSLKGKEQIMLQQVKVTSSGPAPIKPLIESAIRAQLIGLEHGIQRTRQRLAEFEHTYKMSSAEFEAGFESGQIEESLDFIEWLGEIKTLQLLEEQLSALQSATVK
jgi:hypothetical protein